jgi:hypothetical protein
MDLHIFHTFLTFTPFFRLLTFLHSSKNQLSVKYRLLVNFETFSYFWSIFWLFGLVQACTSQKSLLQVYQCTKHELMHI